MKNLTWQNPEQLFVAQELINKVKSKCCGIKDYLNIESDTSYIYDDFFNETHLSEIGAEKFTTRLSNYIKDFLSE